MTETTKTAKIAKAIRRYFVGGLLIWLPIWATYIVIKFLINIMDSSVKLLPTEYQPHTLFGIDIPGFGLILTLIILIATGLFATNFIGNRVLGFWERVLSRIPLIRSIYAAVKQVTEALLKPSGNSFRKVVMVEFPRKGIWSIGFQTSDAFAHGPDKDEHYITVFVPTTPNPTSGFLLVIPKKEVTELDMSVEEGLKMIISIGVVDIGKPKDVNMHTL